MPRKDLRRGKPEKILIILLSEMGSLVLAQSMFRFIRDRYPKASLYALLFEKNREVLDLMDFGIEKVFTIDDSSFGRFAIDSARAILALRRSGIDAAIDCELFSRISSIFSRLSGARLICGFHRHTQEGLYRGDFTNRPVLYNPYNHISRQFVALVEALDSDTLPAVKTLVLLEDEPPRQIKLDKQEIEEMKGRLERDFPAIKNKKLVLLYPGGGLLPIRAWPPKYFARLAFELSARGYAIAIIGLKGDKPLAVMIRAFCPEWPA